MASLQPGLKDKIMAKKKHRPAPASGPKAARPKPIPPRLLYELSEVDALIEREKWREALDILDGLNGCYPRREEVLEALANAAYHVDDMRRYEQACEQLLPFRADDPDVTLGLAGAYLKNARPALALRTFRRFLERWPEHERVADVRETVGDLETAVAGMLADSGIPGAPGVEFAELHEEVQLLMERGRSPEARKVAAELLRRQPDFAPVLNNISQTYFMEGDLANAITTGHRVIAFAPDNVHALSNLTRYCCVRGQFEEARQWAEQLKASTAPAADRALKVIEALSYLGDDEAVLAAFRRAETAGDLKPPWDNPLAYHLAAVAAYRMGRKSEAHRYWDEALRLQPDFALARDNVDDLQQPIGLRHAPWPFSFGLWVQPRTIADLVTQTQPASRRGSADALQRAVRTYLQRHPELVKVIPVLLERGNPSARDFSMRIALWARTPEMLEAMRDFALGQRGPDAMRHEAAQAASEAGLLPSGYVRLWTNGEWQEVLILGVELHDEAIVRHSRHQKERLIEAIRATTEGDGRRSEELLRQALELEPDAPDIWMNLAYAIEMQGRKGEAYGIVRELHARHPDYAFARLSLARKALKDGDIAGASDLLQGMYAHKRLHFKELATWCAVQIELFLAEGKPDAARAWFEMWQDTEPDNPSLNQSRQLLIEAGAMKGQWRISPGLDS